MGGRQSPHPGRQGPRGVLWATPAEAKLAISWLYARLGAANISSRSLLVGKVHAPRSAESTPVPQLADRPLYTRKVAKWICVCNISAVRVETEPMICSLPGL